MAWHVPKPKTLPHSPYQFMGLLSKGKDKMKTHPRGVQISEKSLSDHMIHWEDDRPTMDEDSWSQGRKNNNMSIVDHHHHRQQPHRDSRSGPVPFPGHPISTRLLFYLSPHSSHPHMRTSSSSSARRHGHQMIMNRSVGQWIAIIII